MYLTTVVCEKESSKKSPLYKGEIAGLGLVRRFTCQTA